MKQIIFTFLLFVSAIGFSQDNCKQFIQGKYAEEGNLINGYIEFKGDFLYEVDGNEYIKSKITWVDDCSYKLTLVETNIKDVVIPKGAELDVTILTAKPDEFTVTFDFMPTELSEPIRMVRYKD